MKTKGFVLLSGGIDSSTALAIASYKHTLLEGVSVDYGQRHLREIEAAKVQCKNFGCDHSMINIPHLLGHSMLTDPGVKIPNVKYDQIEGVSPTYVPFRNGTLLSLIAARAQGWVTATFDPGTGRNDDEPREAVVYIGAHAEDARNWAYPDCTPEFIGSMASAIYIGTYHKVRLHAPLLHMEKHEIVKLGAGLGVKFEDTWSCYAGRAAHCGKCPTCYARQDAFKKAGVPDPTMYYTD